MKTLDHRISNRSCQTQRCLSLIESLSLFFDIVQCTMHNEQFFNVVYDYLNLKLKIPQHILGNRFYQR